MQFLLRDEEKLPLAGSSHCVFKGDRLSENYLPDSIFAPSVERCGPEMMMVCPGNITPEESRNASLEDLDK